MCATVRPCVYVVDVCDSVVCVCVSRCQRSLNNCKEEPKQAQYKTEL
jgi:hypothetical protein